MLSERREFVKFLLSTSVLWPSLSSCAPAKNDKQALPKGWITTPLVNAVGLPLDTQLNCSVSADGEKCVFRRLDAAGNVIALVDFDSHTFVSISLDEQIRNIFDVVISADGQKIALVIYKGTPPELESEIWLMNSSGIIELKLTGTRRSKLSPAFSPDGKKLAFFADMRHQYLRDISLYVFGTMTSSSVAVHELDIETGQIRLLAMPILPTAKGCFYSDNGTLLSTWMSQVEDKEFSQLPVNCLWGNMVEFGGRNNFQQFRPRLQQTIGEVQLDFGDEGLFKKFEMKMPNFDSIRDTFFVSNSPCENGFLTTPRLWDKSKDPSLELFANYNYYPTDWATVKIGLSWLTRDGQREDIALPSGSFGIAFASGSFDRSRVVVWAGVNNRGAVEEVFPWTKSTTSAWHKIELVNVYKVSNTIHASENNHTRTIELPKLIDRRGIGKTMDGRFSD